MLVVGGAGLPWAALAVEAANKNIKKIVQKMTVSYKDWHEMLPFVLHGYRTSVHTSIGATPFSLVYGMEVVLLFEVEVPSLRILVEFELTEGEFRDGCFDVVHSRVRNIYVKLAFHFRG